MEFFVYICIVQLINTKNIMKLTTNNQETLFAALKIGDVFTYSDAFFPHEIITRAFVKNIVVEYCPPGSPEYKEFGSQTMKVVDVNNQTIISTIDTLFNTLAHTDKWKVLEMLGEQLNVQYFG